MSEKPLTPGPWTVHRRMKDCVTFIGRHGEENLFLQNLDGYYACQSEADARLISTAPELLTALCRLLRWGERQRPGSEFTGDHPIARARAAIDKATQ